MKLDVWLEVHGKSPSQFAAELGVHHTTITRLIPKPGKRQRRGAGDDLVRKIKAATDGEVTADDLLVDEDAAEDPADDPSGRPLSELRAAG